MPTLRVHRRPQPGTLSTTRAGRGTPAAPVPHRHGVADPVDLPQLVLRRAALRRGLDDGEIARLRRRGTWTRLQRGAYLVGGQRLDERVRHLFAVRATVAALRTPATLSHASAAAVHGLPLWQVPLHRVHITRTPPARSEVGTRLRSHVARVPEADVVEVAGMAVTSAARTVVDLACWLPFPPALAVADAALRLGQATPVDLSRAVDAVRGTRGSRGAARVVAHADGRSESVGESRSRAVMIEQDLPAPELQVTISSPRGVFLGRCDFGWLDRRLLGEFDGRIKYGRLLRPGQQPGDAVFEEKLREDALRDEDYGVVRWTWRDLDQPVRWAETVRRRLLRAS